MKITVCGKGGCGKSTVTSLLSKALARRGKETLVIDSDESNYGLHRQLGMKLPRDFTDYFGGKQNVLNDMMLSKFTHQFFEETWTIDDIPEDYYSLKDGVKLMTSGKIHQANEGCSCAMGTVATVYKGNIIKNLIMDCQSYTKYRPNETTGGIFVSWRRKEELPTGA